MHLLKSLKENNNMERIVLATGNKGKIREFERAFSHMNITCVPVKDIVDVPEPGIGHNLYGKCHPQSEIL